MVEAMQRMQEAHAAALSWRVSVGREVGVSFTLEDTRPFFQVHLEFHVALIEGSLNNLLDAFTYFEEVDELRMEQCHLRLMEQVCALPSLQQSLRRFEVGVCLDLQAPMRVATSADLSPVNPFPMLSNLNNLRHLSLTDHRAINVPREQALNPVVLAKESFTHLQSYRYVRRVNKLIYHVRVEAEFEEGGEHPADSALHGLPNLRRVELGDYSVMQLLGTSSFSSSPLRHFRHATAIRVLSVNTASPLQLPSLAWKNLAAHFPHLRSLSLQHDSSCRPPPDFDSPAQLLTRLPVLNDLAPLQQLHGLTSVRMLEEEYTLQQLAEKRQQALVAKDVVTRSAHKHCMGKWEDRGNTKHRGSVSL
jgi:hypothetical protein